MVYELPTHGAQIQQVLSIPDKRHVKKQVGFLHRKQFDALLAAPDRNTWSGRRDHAFILTAVQTALRVSEITSLKTYDLSLKSAPHLSVIGKGRKQRTVPLAKPVCAVLKDWLRQPPRGTENVLFPNRNADAMTIHGVQYLLRKHRASAIEQCSTLKSKPVTVHLLRRTAAMDLVQAGVDRSTIALWLGHQTIQSTEPYIEATLELKQRALAKVTPHQSPLKRFKATDRLIDYLNGLG